MFVPLFEGHLRHARRLYCLGKVKRTALHSSRDEVQTRIHHNVLARRIPPDNHLFHSDVMTCIWTRPIDCACHVEQEGALSELRNTLGFLPLDIKRCFRRIWILVLHQGRYPFDVLVHPRRSQNPRYRRYGCAHFDQP